MAQYVRFDEGKRRVSLRDVLGHYGLRQESTERNTKRGVELRLRCPFHDDTTPSLSINAETGKFHCCGCNAKGGDIFAFVVTKAGMSAGDRIALGIFGDGQALPLHPGVENPQDEVKDALIAQFTLRPPLRHREVRQEKCVELWFREWDRNRCRCRLLCRGAHRAMASGEKW